MKSDQDIFDYLDALLWAVAHGFLQFAPDGSAKCSSYCLTNDGCAANLRRPQENERSPIILSKRSGRGSRLFDRGAVPNVPASRRNRSGRRYNQGRECNTADRQSRP